MSAFVGALQGFGAFTEGYLKGQKEVEHEQRERERFALERQQAELVLKRHQDEQAMRDELKAVEAKPVPTPVFKVVTPEGPVVYADEKLAKEHFNQVAGSGGEFRTGYSVAGKLFDSEGDAKTAADAMSTPAAIARRQMEIAQKYSNPQMASMYMDNYRKAVEQNKREIQDNFLDAYKRGDIEAAADLFTSRLANGEDAKVVPLENGAFAIIKTKNGQPVGQPQRFASADEFWHGTAERPGLLANIAMTPDNVAEMWKAGQGLQIQRRQLDQQGKYQDAVVRQGDRKIDIDEKATNANIDIQRGQLRVSQQNAGTAASQVGLGYAQLNQPKVHSGIDANGNVTFGATQTPFDPKTKTYGLKVLGPQTADGMKPTPRASSGLDLSAFMTPQQQALDLSILSKLPPKNLGGATK